MKKIAAADVVIFGGGVAGLWLLNRLRQAGLSALLFESHALGGEQMHKSQGIIQGEMKDAWQACLQDRGELHLSGVTVLSSQHYLWAPHPFTAMLPGFLGNSPLTNNMAPLSYYDYPAIFQHPDFKGEVFALDEIVLDTASLVRELMRLNQDAIFKMEPLAEELHWDEHGHLLSVNVYMAGMAVEIEAQQFIFAACAGNEIIIKKFMQQERVIDRQSLHRVLVKVPASWQLYADCLGLGSHPRMTITTHRLQAGSYVWHLGGVLAEEGVNRNQAAQIEAAKQELSDLFPWHSFQNLEWASFLVDRIELSQKESLDSQQTYYQAYQNTIIAWPVTLALVPQLANEVLAHLQSIALTPQLLDVRELRAWPMPPLAIPIWEELFCKMPAL